MNFSLSEELIEMKRSIRDFIDHTVDPLAQQIEEMMKYRRSS